MPYFKWVGVNLAGVTRTGKTFAQSEQALDAMLFKRDVALLRCNQCHPSFFGRSISLKQKIDFFHQLSILLKSGILLPEALMVINEQLDNPRLQEVVNAVSRDVASGLLFSDALRKFPDLFNQVMVQMVHVGNEAGILAESLTMLSGYLESHQEFNKRMRAALLMPILTLIFFLIIAVLIFTIIIPQFTILFSSAKQQLPPLTRKLILVSDFIRSWYAVVVLVGIGMIFVMARKYAQSPGGRWRVDGLALRLPIIADVVRYSAMMYLCRSLAMLLKGGMPLVPAMRSAKNSVTNVVLEHHVQYLEREIEAGSSLSVAMAQHPEQIFEQELLSIIKVGEESGQLIAMLEQVAASYQERVNRLLMMVTTLIQPILMIILGLLVTLLIFAVYLPIFSLSQVM